MKIITNLCNQCDNEQCIFQSGICRNDCDFFIPKKKNDDLISRQAARNALLNKGQHSKRYKLGETWELNLMEIEEALGELPSVTLQPEIGHWIMKHRTHNSVKHYTGQDEMGETHTISVLERYEVDEPYCSECGKLAGDTSQNYCCACGAKMYLGRTLRYSDNDTARGKEANNERFDRPGSRKRVDR